MEVIGTFICCNIIWSRGEQYEKLTRVFLQNLWRKNLKLLSETAVIQK